MKQFLERFANWRTKLWGMLLALVDPKADAQLDKEMVQKLKEYLAEPGMPIEGRSSQPPVLSNPLQCARCKDETTV